MTLCRISVVGCRIEIFTYGPLQDFVALYRIFEKVWPAAEIMALYRIHYEVSKSDDIGTESLGNKSFSRVLGLENSNLRLLWPNCKRLCSFMLLHL